MAFDLKINQFDVVPGRPRCASHDLKSQRLQPQEDLGVHQARWVNEENLHAEASGCRAADLPSYPFRASIEFKQSLGKMASVGRRTILDPRPKASA
jgi:hypothetical protein